MWVCIRPGVVRSANEERVVPRCIPVQFIVSMEAISFRILVGAKLKTLVAWHRLAGRPRASIRQS